MKKLMWVLIALAFLAYGLIVWGWIQEGNANFERQRMEANQ